MGKATWFINVETLEELDEIADKFAEEYSDRNVYPTGKYHGNLTVITGTIFKTSDEAKDFLEKQASDAPEFHDFVVPFRGRKPKKKLSKAVLEYREKVKDCEKRLDELYDKLYSPEATPAERAFFTNEIVKTQYRYGQYQEQLYEAESKNTVLSGKTEWMARLTVPVPDFDY